MATYFVATTGSDAADGSSGAPWQTFAHVCSKINDGTVTAGDVVQFADGTYTETAQRSISAGRGGSAGAPVTLIAANPQQAHIQWTNDVADVRLWISGSWITFDSLRLSAPRQVAPDLTNVNANWIIRTEPAFGGAAGIVVSNCLVEGTGFFKNTGLNSQAATVNWSEGCQLVGNDILVSGAAIDFVNVYAPLVRNNFITMQDAGVSSIVLQTKGGSRMARVLNNTVHLVSGQAQYGLMAGGQSSWGGTPDYIFDTAGHEGYGHVIANNIIVADPGARFTFGFIPVIGAIDTVVANNVIIGSGDGRGIHLVRTSFAGWGTGDGHANAVNTILHNTTISNVATAVSIDVGVENLLSDITSGAGTVAQRALEAALAILQR